MSSIHNGPRTWVKLEVVELHGIHVQLAQRLEPLAVETAHQVDAAVEVLQPHAAIQASLAEAQIDVPLGGQRVAGLGSAGQLQLAAAADR